MALFFAGCGNKNAPDTKAPVLPRIGIIDMQKAVEGHPKYNQVTILQQEYDLLAAKLERELRQSADTTLLSDFSQPGQAMEQVNRALEQEFNSKMAAKQNEVNEILTAKAQGFQQQLSDEFKAYSEQVDAEYNPQIFNLQLKMKTVQITQEEGAALQSQMEKLQQERAEKLNRKHQELAGRMEQLMAPEKAAAEKTMNAYAQEVQTLLSQKATEKGAELSKRQNPLPVPDGSLSTQAQQQLTAKRQEIEALQQYIVENIRTQTGKVAVAKGLDAVITKVLVNVSAVDITDEVIAQCNK